MEPAPIVQLTPGWRKDVGPRQALLPIALGILSGGFAAWAYYGEAFNQLAHTFGLWVLMVVLLSARRSMPEAVVRSVIGLAAAVLTFYLGKKVMYGIEYPGMPYPLNVDEIVQWLVPAVPAGLLLGAAAALIGRSSRAGTLATAAIIGLLVADTYRRVSHYHQTYHPTPSVVMVGFCLLAVAIVLTMGARSQRQLALILLGAPLFAVLGYLLVSAPDALEQIMITGGLT